MAGREKSSSHEHSMLGFRQFCRRYSCFVWRRHRSALGKLKSITERRSSDCFISFDETCKTSKAISEDRTGTKNMNNVLRSNKSSEVHNNNEIPNSPTCNSRSSSHTPLSRTSSLFKNTIRTPTSTKTRSLTGKSGPVKRSSSTERLETKTRGRSGPLFTQSRERSGVLAHSGPLLKSLDQKGSPNIMYSKSNGLVQLLAIEESLECSLEELCFGCVKKITFARAVIANNGQIVEEEETLSIKVKPGWTKGTKITFEGIKDEEKETHSCDVIFVIKEERHALYRREGDDIELAVRVPLLQALTGCNLSIPLLGGDKLNLMIDEIIVPGYEKIIEGEGMPKSKEQGHRGNLKIKFLVDFPEELTENQRRNIATILKDSC